MRRLADNWLWLVLALSIAGITHIVTINVLPQRVMQRVFTHLGDTNSIHHGQRPDAHTRTVVRPSPNMLYSICAYDLAAGVLRVTAPVPSGTYWSVSAFDARSNNYVVENDRQVGKRVDFLVAAPNTHPALQGLPVVNSPTLRGVILFRTVINTEARFTQLDQIRHVAQCTLALPAASR